LGDYVIIFVTTRDKEEAKAISQILLQKRLIACANIISPVTSFFHWAGKIDNGEECLMVMKSRSDLVSEVADHVKQLHSYEVPEILAVPIVVGSEAYLEWMGVVLKPKL